MAFKMQSVGVSQFFFLINGLVSYNGQCFNNSVFLQNIKNGIESKPPPVIFLCTRLCEKGLSMHLIYIGSQCQYIEILLNMALHMQPMQVFLNLLSVHFVLSESHPTYIKVPFPIKKPRHSLDNENGRLIIPISDFDRKMPLCPL